MAVVTLHTGRVVNLNRDNVDGALREQLDSYKAAGFDVEGSGLGAGTQEAFYKLAGVGYDTTARDESQKLAQSVIDNPFASASKDVVDALPDPIARSWQNSSDSIFSGAAALEAGGKSFVASAWDNIKAIASKIPYIADQTNGTVRIVAISAAVIVVGGAGVYLTFKFKK